MDTQQIAQAISVLVEHRNGYSQYSYNELSRARELVASLHLDWTQDSNGTWQLTTTK